MVANRNESKPRSIAAETHPFARFYPDLLLLKWHPQGALDDARVDQGVEYIEWKERVEGVAFNRYFDMTGYTRIQVSLDHIVRLARRRLRIYRGGRVKTAIYAVRLISIHIAQMYEELMRGSRIEVRIFRDRTQVAEWLGVPKEALIKKSALE